MVGHLRSGTLDKFKEAFDNALNRGQGFAVAARDCTESFMKQFDEGCAGTVQLQIRFLSYHICLEQSALSFSSALLHNSSIANIPVLCLCHFH